MASLVRRFGAHWCEGALKERVINYIALVVFSFDDPVAGKDLALADIGEEDGSVLTLSCFYEKGSAGPKGLQLSSPRRRCSAREVYLSTVLVKKAYGAHKKTILVQKWVITNGGKFCRHLL